MQLVYSHVVMSQLEGWEHVNRISKYLPLGIPRGKRNVSGDSGESKEKGFAFVNFTLHERLNDLARSQRELGERITALKISKGQVK